ncbi:MAG: tRNA (adenosine(37)-N6)-dimethylallyltransferase MiaA [Clostridiales bacterium]|nr:tRNA (adenosine(37)-N6)-dimethylallyltransferase MiaA [Clostridiales bacterium]
MSKPVLLCLVGPTACHKSEAAVRLAKRLGCEIVSCDSVAVYRDFDIGAAKPTSEERQGIAHHMLDCVSAHETDFSVSAFQSMAREAIDGIFARGALPLLVGGSGLYVDAVLSPLAFATPSDPMIRARLAKEYEKDAGAVFKRLREADPASAERLHPNDAKRVIRALEVFLCSGRTLSDWSRSFIETQRENQAYQVIKFGLFLPRPLLYARIEARVDAMMARGFLDEVRDLRAKGYSPALPAMRAIGYEQLNRHLDGHCTIDEAVAEIKQATRNFAKRQLTWFRRDPKLRWFDLSQYTDLNEVAGEMERIYYER